MKKAILILFSIIYSTICISINCIELNFHVWPPNPESPTFDISQYRNLSLPLNPSFTYAGHADSVHSFRNSIFESLRHLQINSISFTNWTIFRPVIHYPIVYYIHQLRRIII